MAVHPSSGRGGNLARRLDQSYRPPSLPLAPGSPSNVVRARLVIIAGPGISGEFLYQGTPAFGNPPIAWSAPPGTATDPFGNPLPVSGGFATEQFGGGLLAQLAAGALILSDTAAASPFTATSSLQIVHTGAATAEPITALQSAAADAAGTVAVIWVLGGPGSGTPEPQIVMFANDLANAPSALASLFLFGPLTFLSGINTSPFGLVDAASLRGAAGDLTVVSSQDGNTYDTERLTQTYENINITAVTGAGTTLISTAVPVVAGPTYLVRARLSYAEAAAGTPTINVRSPALNATFSQSIGNWQQTAASVSFGRFGASLNSALGGPTMTGVRQNFVFEGYAIFTAAGTVQLQGSTSNAADVWNVTGGTFEVFPVTV